MLRKSIFINEKTAKSLANLMKSICYFVIFFFIFGVIMSLIGRQQVILHTPTGTFNNAIYAEKNHDFTSRGPSVTMSDDVHITTDSDMHLSSQIVVSVMYLINIIPIIISFWFLAKLFNNISIGNIFTEQNAKYLLYYGLIQIITAVVVPFVKLFICFLTNFFTSDRISISTGQDMITNLIPNIAFIVAAYIIHYGVQLQDEVDHTL